MPTKIPSKRKLTDADRHQRFKDMARQVGASDDPKAFDRAFRNVTAGVKALDQDRLTKSRKGNRS